MSLKQQETPQSEIKILSQPIDYTDLAGETATFTVRARGEELTYQWQYSKGDKWRNSSAEGSDTVSLSIKITEARDGQQYRCVITDKYGTEVISDIRFLSD